MRLRLFLALFAALLLSLGAVPASALDKTSAASTTAPTPVVNPPTVTPPEPIDQAPRPLGGKHCATARATKPDAQALAQNTTQADCTGCGFDVNCHVSYIVGNGDFSTTFRAVNEQGQIYSTTGDYYCASATCTYGQGGGGIGWAPLSWTVTGNAAYIIDHYCYV